MLRNIMITGTAVCLSMGSSLARADHDNELRYVVGGAILGAAIGELAYARDVPGYVSVSYGYRPYGVYVPPRYYGYYGPYRHWDRGQRMEHWIKERSLCSNLQLRTAMLSFIFPNS